MAACTSVAAPSRLFERSNCSTKLECPWILFEVTISNPGKGTATDVTLNDPLPAGVADDINWSIDTSDKGLAAGTVAADFQITGSVGKQVLSLSPSFADTLAAGQSISVHYVGVTSTDDIANGATSASLLNVASATAKTGSTALNASAQATVTLTVTPPPPPSG